MGFFTDLKEDLSQAVNELVPEEAAGRPTDMTEEFAAEEEIWAENENWADDDWADETLEDAAKKNDMAERLSSMLDKLDEQEMMVEEDGTGSLKMTTAPAEKPAELTAAELMAETGLTAAEMAEMGLVSPEAAAEEKTEEPAVPEIPEIPAEEMPVSAAAEQADMTYGEEPAVSYAAKADTAGTADAVESVMAEPEMPAGYTAEEPETDVETTGGETEKMGEITAMEAETAGTAAEEAGFTETAAAEETALEETTEAAEPQRIVSDEVAVVTAGMKIVGDVTSDGSLEVVGTVTGNIEIWGKLNIAGTVVGNSKAMEVYAENARINGEVTSEGSVKIGQSSVVIGNIFAASAVIAGAVKGDIDVQGPVILDTTAIVMGNIKSKSVQINNGAVIEGMCSLTYADVNPTSFFEAFQ